MNILAVNYIPQPGDWHQYSCSLLQSLQGQLPCTIYNDNTKKVTFTLSFMREGSAATWASTVTKKALTLTPPSLRTWNDLCSHFKESFIHINVKNESIAWLTTTTISKTLPLRDYISQFKNHIALSEITNEDALINFFERGISIPLMKRIYAMVSPPQSKIGIPVSCTSKLNGMQQMPPLADILTTLTQHRRIITKATKASPKLTHMLWMSTPSTLKNSPRRKGKNASEKVSVSDAGNLGTIPETAPCSPTTPLVQM